jgi:hypothetical protein
MLLMIALQDIRGEYELTFDSKTYKWVSRENSCPKIRDKKLEAKKLDSKFQLQTIGFL